MHCVIALYKSRFKVKTCKKMYMKYIRYRELLQSKDTLAVPTAKRVKISNKNIKYKKI